MSFLLLFQGPLQFGFLIEDSFAAKNKIDKVEDRSIDLWIRRKNQFHLEAVSSACYL